MSDVFGGLSAKDFLSDAETKVAYSGEITRSAMAKSKIKPFIAKSENQQGAIIKSVRKTLEQGTPVGVTLEDDLTESGAIGNVDFDASAEELKSIKQFIKVDRYQHKVPSTEDIISQRTSDKFKGRAKTALTNWETRKFDKVFFSAMSADCTNIVCSGQYDTQDCSNILKANVLTTDDVSEARRRAENGVTATGKKVPPLVPVYTMQNENLGFYEDLDFYVMLVGSNSARHIKNDANWAEARKELATRVSRDQDNPLLNSALGIWDGVLLLNVKTDNARQSGILTSKSEFVGFGNVKKIDLSTYAGNSGQETEINLMLGAGAGYIVVDKGVAYYDWEDSKDPRRMNAGIDRVYGYAKTKYKASDNDGILKDSIFDGNDYGVIAVVSSTGM
jgi:predicted RNA-binding protein